MSQLFVLQDVHWGGGGFEYFPTYSLGNIIAGMLVHRIKNDFNFKDTVAKGDLARIKVWLKRNCTAMAPHSPKDLQGPLFGEEYNPEWLLKYLEGKYAA